MIEKLHPHCHALTLDHCFTYHMALEGAREQRQAAEMRSDGGGARRKAACEKAEQQRALHGTNRSYKQQLALCEGALRLAAGYTNKELFARGPSGVAQQNKAAKAAYKKAREQLATIKAESLRSTCGVTATGRSRKAALTLQACRKLVPAMFSAGESGSRDL